MPIKATITLSGYKEYLERLAKAGKNVDAVADQALIAGADVLLEGMQNRVPVLTGNLKDNLKRSEPVTDGTTHSIDVGLIHGVDPDTARYGAVQEYGSSSNAAQPYIRPAVDEDKRKVRKAMRDVLKNAGLEDVK